LRFELWALGFAKEEHVRNKMAPIGFAGLLAAICVQQAGENRDQTGKTAIKYSLWPFCPLQCAPRARRA